MLAQCDDCLPPMDLSPACPLIEYEAAILSADGSYVASTVPPTTPSFQTITQRQRAAFVPSFNQWRTQCPGPLSPWIPIGFMGPEIAYSLNGTNEVFTLSPGTSKFADIPRRGNNWVLINAIGYGENVLVLATFTGTSNSDDWVHLIWLTFNRVESERWYRVHPTRVRQGQVVLGAAGLAAVTFRTERSGGSNGRANLFYTRDYGHTWDSIKDEWNHRDPGPLNYWLTIARDHRLYYGLLRNNPTEPVTFNMSDLNWSPQSMREFIYEYSPAPLQGVSILSVSNSPAWNRLAFSVVRSTPEGALWQVMLTEDPRFIMTIYDHATAAALSPNGSCLAFRLANSPLVRIVGWWPWDQPACAPRR